MAEEIKETEVVEEVVQEEVDTQESTEQQPEKKYTQEELEEIIKARVAREKKATEKAVEEAAKLAKMNADEKEKYEREQLEERLAEYERKEQFYSLSKEASNMLSEHDIHADDDLLQLVVKDDADATKTAVESFVKLINAKVEQGVKQALSGTAPKVNVTGNTAPITMDDVKNMSKEEINKNWDRISKIKQ